MCEAPQNLRSLALLSPESKAVRCCVLDHNSNELGVDFRRLLGSTDTLLASGQIDQVQELFYPAGR